MKNKKLKILIYILNRQDNWIKDADTKSSIAIGVLVVILRALFEIPSEIKKIYPIKIINDTIIILCILSLIAALISFIFLLLPKLDYKSISQGSNLYFGDISKKSIYQFNKSINKELHPDKLLKRDLQNQIYIASKIATKKMRCFKYELSFILITFILLAILYVLTFHY